MHIMCSYVKDFIYGAKKHSGNIHYIFISGGCFVAGLQNKTAPWWAGLLPLVILIPLYIITSYSIGREKRSKK